MTSFENMLAFRGELLIIGKYRIIRRIGGGSFGDIFLGINISNGEVHEYDENSFFEFWRSVPRKGKLEQVLMFVKSRFVNYVPPQDQEKNLKTFLKKECEKK